jgi:hypothetical protein
MNWNGLQADDHRVRAIGANAYEEAGLGLQISHPKFCSAKFGFRNDGHYRG